ncbi:MAG TPA: GntR family transcriptional regulator [Solirubrobacteraceae bacterium]|nr:GntR family transcriptional regulator [Solirubrobacteraceae bacterium]
MAQIEETNTRDGQHVAIVHERLRNAILRGEIEAGATTSQTALAQLLDAGRTPLREALRMLQREGLVISEPNRRVRIADLSSDDAEELYIMRIALECVAIRITVPTLTSDDFAALEGYMAQMAHYMKVGDMRGWRIPHMAFHTVLIAGAGPRVTAEIDQLFDHAERYRLRWGVTGAWESRAAEHAAIVAAAAEGDADRAALRLAEHYAVTAALVFRGMDPDHDLARLRTTMDTVAPGAAKKLTLS